MLKYLEVQELCIRIIHATLDHDEEMVADLGDRLERATGIEDAEEMFLFIKEVMSRVVCHN